MTDILGSGKSSRLYKQLVDTKQYFNTIEAYTTESSDPGLCIISGSLNDGISFETAEDAIQAVIAPLQSQLVAAEELEKVKNQAEAHRVFSEVDLLHRAQELAMATVLGDTNLANREAANMRKVTDNEILHAAQHILSPNNCSTIHYQRK